MQREDGNDKWWLPEMGKRITRCILQYSGSLQWDSLSGETSVASSRYRMEEHEEVRTTRFTDLALAQDLITFAVPLMHGSTRVACNNSSSCSKTQTFI